jgi:hypothetical protein
MHGTISVPQQRGLRRRWRELGRGEEKAWRGEICARLFTVLHRPFHVSSRLYGFVTLETLATLATLGLGERMESTIEAVGNLSEGSFFSLMAAALICLVCFGVAIFSTFDLPSFSYVSSSASRSRFSLYVA